MFFQVPMLVAHQTRGAVGIVVSPLVSLMVDQVSRLRRLGIRAGYVTPEKGAQSVGSETGALSMLAAFPSEGEPPSPIVYLSAEMVENKLAVIQAFAKNHSVSLIAIDEAHCISSWGDAFRPAYRRLSKLREALPDTPCIALTATANQRVKDDIISSLSLNHRNGAGIIQDSFDRPNIRLQVEKKPEKGSLSVAEAGAKAIAPYIQGVSSIVYCPTVKGVTAIADALRAEMDCDIGVYHGGLPDATRAETQALWVGGTIKTIVSTTAFGMGIDKADVRCVVHWGLPASITQYYQEIGRAGRDGSPANAVMFFGESDDHATRQLQGLGAKDGVDQQALECELAEVTRYAKSCLCKRRGLLFHFGEVMMSNKSILLSCGNCSSCDSDEHQRTVDVTSHAKTLFRTLQDSKCNSLNDLVLILLGSQQQRIKQHRQLATFATGKEEGKPWWKELGSALEASRWLEMGRVTMNKNSYGKLRLSCKAIDVLNGKCVDAVEVLCDPGSLLLH